MEWLNDLQATRRASRQLAQCQPHELADLFHHLAQAVRQAETAILSANARDLERMPTSDPKYDRLLLTPARLEQIVQDILHVAALPSPLHRIKEQRQLPNGLLVEQITVPLGVIGVVFESRPNVTFDVAALCLKSGNAAVLKGSRDAHWSNQAIVACLQEALAAFGLAEALYLAPSEREALLPLLRANGLIDVIIPRGGQALIEYVRTHATVPTIETGAGIVHVYFDASGDLQRGKTIVENAKTRRVSVCNALDCLVVHRQRLLDLVHLVAPLAAHGVKLFADPPALQVLQAHYPASLLAPATPAHFGQEFLSLQMAIKIVDDFEAALEHLSTYSSQHSEAIIAEDALVQEAFLRRVDAAVVYVNASTAFTDGAQMGLGAEIGISTQKLHARGPMGLEALTSYKWLVRGQGQIRPKN